MSKLVITRFQDALISLFLNDKGEALEISAEKDQNQSLRNNIYLGQVKNIVANINAAFIDIADGISCYCSLRERAPYLFGAHGSQNKLCIGDYVLVQVTKENIKTKQPTVSAKLELAGKNLVLLHGEKGIKLSKKLTDSPELSEKKEALSAYCTDSFGFILRTNSLHATINQIKTEAEYLAKLFCEISEQGIHKSRGALVYQALPWYVEELMDVPEQELTEVVTDLPEIYEQLSEYAAKFQPEDLSKLHLYTNTDLSLGSLFSLQKIMKEAMYKQVWMKSGAFLVIEPTEALTAIDVNTGKAVTGRKTGDELFFQINKEAAVEVMRQLRLRNLSGMILIDFINMNVKAYEDELLLLLRKLAANDRLPVSVLDMTELKLVELTRKKEKKPLHEVFSVIFNDYDI